MVIKGRLPLLLLFLSTLFLAASVRSALGTKGVDERCAAQCRDFKKPAIRSVCEEKCSTSGGGSSIWFHDEMDQCIHQCPQQDLACKKGCVEQQGRQQPKPQIPRETYEKICQKSCEMQTRVQQQQQQCQRMCNRQFEDQQQDSRRDPEQRVNQSSWIGQKDMFR